MPENIREKSCGAVISAEIDGEARLLLIKHKNGGHWAFPKGHMEAGETEKETAIREIREETGLVVTLDTRFRETVSYSPKKNVMKDVIYFAAKAEGQDPIPQPEEVSELRWVAFKEAMSLVTFENDRNVLQAYLEFSQAT